MRKRAGLREGRVTKVRSFHEMTADRGNKMFVQLHYATSFSTINHTQNTMKEMFWHHGKIPLLIAPVSTRPHLCKEYMRREFSLMRFDSVIDNF
jgi:hypothetical protein